METEAILERAIAGDVRAQNQLFDEWLPQVLGWAARMGGTRVDPEDVASDVFITVLTRLETLRDRQAFPSWIFQITRRSLAKHRRRAWIKRWVGEPTGDAMDEGGTPHDALESSELRGRVVEILETLPQKQREVLVLCDLEERSNPEVAEMLDIPVGTVASRLRLARGRFKKGAKRRALHLAIEGGTT